MSAVDESTIAYMANILADCGTDLADDRAIILCLQRARYTAAEINAYYDEAVQAARAIRQQYADTRLSIGDVVAAAFLVFGGGAFYSVATMFDEMANIF